MDQVISAIYNNVHGWLFIVGQPKSSLGTKFKRNIWCKTLVTDIAVWYSLATTWGWEGGRAHLEI